MTGKSLNAEILIEFAHALNQQNNFQEILRLISEQASSLLGADNVSLSMLNPHTQQTVKTVYREFEHVYQKYMKLLAAQVSGWMVSSQKPFITEDISKDNRFRKKYVDKTDIKSIIGVLIRVEGIIIGSLLLLKNN